MDLRDRVSGRIGKCRSKRRHARSALFCGWSDFRRVVSSILRRTRTSESHQTPSGLHGLTDDHTAPRGVPYLFPGRVFVRVLGGVEFLRAPELRSLAPISFGGLARSSCSRFYATYRLILACAGPPSQH